LYAFRNSLSFVFDNFSRAWNAAADANARLQQQLEHEPRPRFGNRPFAEQCIGHRPNSLARVVVIDHAGKIKGDREKSKGTGIAPRSLEKEEAM
jgi:hypothetical protein